MGNIGQGGQLYPSPTSTTLLGTLGQLAQKRQPSSNLTYNDYYKNFGIGESPEYQPGPYAATGELMPGLTGNVPYGTQARSQYAYSDQELMPKPDEVANKKRQPNITSGSFNPVGTKRVSLQEIPWDLPRLARYRNPNIMRR